MTTYAETPTPREAFESSSASYVWSPVVPDLMEALRVSTREAHRKEYVPLPDEAVERLMDWALHRAPEDGRTVRDNAWR